MKFVQCPPAPPTARPATTILLVRHAETDALGSRLSGRMADVGLNPAGVRQAAGLADRLARIPLTAIYSSPLLRARATAHAIAAARHLAVEIVDDWTEVDFGGWTGLTFTQLSQRDDWRAYNADRGRAFIPGGEAPTASAARVARALHNLHDRHPGGTVAAVTHAELIRYAILRARGAPLAQWSGIEVPPASVTIVECGAVELRAGPALALASPACMGPHRG